MASKDDTCDVIQSEGKCIESKKCSEIPKNNALCTSIARKFFREVLTRNRMTIIDDLKPEDVLNVFIQERFFGEITKRCVRDIQEQDTTTKKNCKIIDATVTDPRRYMIFKTSLATTQQYELLKIIESEEKTIHKENQEKIGDHACIDANNCPLLDRFKCPENVKPMVTRNVLDLREVLLDAYEGMFQHIPIFPGKTLDLEELYVDQELKVIEHYKNTETKRKHGEKFDKDKRISAVADIFKKDSNICKNILISAEGGLGKSIFCKHLVLLWYKAYTQKDAKLTKDQETLKRFELLFYIDLRDATIPHKVPKSDEIAELIHEQLDLTDTCSVADIRKILSGTSALVVMDSLDELGSSRRPKRGIHNKSCIVTTSRPWKIEALRSTLADVDQHIEIVGLSETSPTSLANHVLTLLNTGSEDNPKKDGNAFITDMVEKKLQHLLNIPLLLIQMLGLWFSGETFGDSQFEIYSEVIHQQILSAIDSKELPKYDSKSLKRNFPCCINCSDQCLCKYYEELLWKVSQMAYHTLFSKDRQMCLVFDHNVTAIYQLSTREVDICLKIGLLTQHKLLVKNPTKKKKQVSFPHKTYQEYFASIYLSQPTEDQRPDLDHIRSVISNLDRALELDKVILFCSHIDLINHTKATCQLDLSHSIFIRTIEDMDRVNPCVPRELSRLISEIADNNPSVQEYRHSYDTYHGAPHVDLIEKIQNIIVQAIQQNTTLFLSDLILSTYQYHKVEIRHLDLTAVKTLHIVQYPVCANELKSLELCQNIQKLVLVDSGIDIKNILELVVRNQVTLVTLHLGGIYRRPLDMSQLGGKWRDVLSANLSSLCLCHVKLSHEQCHDFSRFVATSQNLMQVNLDTIFCEAHGNWLHSRNCFVLDFTRNTNLHTVKLSKLKVEDVIFNPQNLKRCVIDLPDSVSAQTSIIKQLDAARSLQELTCCSIKVPSSVLLIQVLPHLHSLQKIVLSCVYFGLLSDACLSATMDTLEYVELFRCTITSAGLRCLINSLPNHKVTVDLLRVSVTDDDNILQEIRNSPKASLKYDSVYKEGDRWYAYGFTFDYKHAWNTIKEVWYFSQINHLLYIKLLDQSTRAYTI